MYAVVKCVYIMPSLDKVETALVTPINHKHLPPIPVVVKKGQVKPDEHVIFVRCGSLVPKLLLRATESSWKNEAEMQKQLSTTKLVKLKLRYFKSNPSAGILLDFKLKKLATSEFYIPSWDSGTTLPEEDKLSEFLLIDSDCSPLPKEPPQSDDSIASQEVILFEF